MTRQLGFALALLSLSAVLVAATAGAGVAAPSGTSGPTAGTLNIRLLLAPNSMDPHKAADTAALSLARFAYDTPVVNYDGAIRPSMATRWKATNKSVTLWFRRDIRCSNGSPFTVADAATSFGRLANRATGSATASVIFGSLNDVKATVNKRQNSVTVTVGAPYGDLLLGMTQAFMICREGLNDTAKLLTQTLGTGPFVLRQVVSGDRYVYAKRPNYRWGPNGQGTNNPAVPDQAIFRLINNETTATNLFLTGGLDITMTLGPDRARLEAANRYFRDIATAEVLGIYFNHRSGRPASAANVRRGLAAAVNRTNLSRAIGGQFARRADTLLLPVSPCQDPTEVRSITPFNLNRARSALTAAGYRLQDGKLMKDGSQMRIKVAMPDLFAPAADYLISAWRQLGIDVSADVRPAGQVVGTLFSGGDWDVVIVGSGANAPSRTFTFVAGLQPPRGLNFMNAFNQRYNTIASLAKRRPTDRASTCKLWNQANKAIHDQVNILPIMFSDGAWWGKNVEFNAYQLAGIWPVSFKARS